MGENPPAGVDDWDRREQRVQFLVQKWGIPRGEARRLLDAREANGS